MTDTQKLAQAIAEAGKRGGFYNGQVDLSGPQLLIILDDLASQCERDQLALTAKDAEIAALRACLKTANSMAEEFERKWYLRGNEIESKEAEIAALRRVINDAWASYERYGETSVLEGQPLIYASVLEEIQDAAMAQAVQPQPDEQAVFETWLAEKCPSGDVSSVQYQWASSSEYKDFLAQAVPLLNN